ncbi:hypothetical protein CF319_g5828 [Tilletia indica]|nr:hypothetical protein CF319_g5828 [Tilletia indica]
MVVPTERKVSIWSLNVFATILAVGTALWLAIWSLLPAPQPSTPRQLRYSNRGRRPGGVIALGVVMLAWALVETLLLVLYLVQRVYWQRPFDRLPLTMERILLPAAHIALGLLIAARLALGAFAMVFVIPLEDTYYDPPYFDPVRRVPYAIGWGASTPLAIFALFMHVKWMRHCHDATTIAQQKQQNDVAMSEQAAEQRAEERLAALRAQHAEAQNDRSRGTI